MRSPASRPREYADVVLPAALWAEADGVMVNSERTLTHCGPAIAPPGEAMPDWQLICRVATAMGYTGFEFDSAAEVFAELAGFHNPRTGWDLRGVDYQRLRRAPVQWPAAPGCADRNPIRYRNDGVSQDLHTAEDGTVPALAFPTPSRRARFLPRPYLPAAELPDDEFPIVFTTGRLAHQWHTMTKTGKVAKLNKLNPRPFLQLHPEDADRARRARRRPGRNPFSTWPGRAAGGGRRRRAAGRVLRADALGRRIRAGPGGQRGDQRCGRRRFAAARVQGVRRRGYRRRNRRSHSTTRA